MLVLLLFLSIKQIFADTLSFSTIQTQNGLVSGTIRKTVNLKKPYLAFRSIPYAEPPVGNLRFEPPQPVRNWNNILKATKDPVECVQGIKTIEGSEDCLYLNIYTTSFNAHNTSLAVMVWIYGGSFFFGNSSYEHFAPDFFLEQDVIVVTFNYRLGIFGFFSTNDLTVPGNMGLKDQLLAFSWVKNNIKSFGGDPNKITIFGQSGGSASVSYHLQSKLSQGLFQRAIMQSGTSLCLWSLSHYENIASDILSSYFHLNDTTSESLVNEMKKIDYKILQTISSKIAIDIFFIGNPRDGLIFAPVIEPEHDGAFFTKKSYQLLLDGKFSNVSTIIGFNSMEANFYINNIKLLPVNIYLSKFNLDLISLVPIDMNINNIFTKLLVNQDIKDYYFGKLGIIYIPNAKTIQFFSDDQFNRPIWKTVKLMSKYSDVYYYEFAYEGLLGNVPKSPIEGVRHGEELNYLWYYPINGTEEDYLMRDKMVKLWTNFAKYGNPTPKKDRLFNNFIWPLAGQQSDLSVFVINKTFSITNSYTRNLQFWNNLYNKYGNPPYSTY